MNKMFLEFKNLSEDTYKIMKYGLLFSGLVCLSAVGVLLAYIFLGVIFFYHLGLSLLQSSFTFAVEFIVCGIVVDFIKKRGFWNGIFLSHSYFSESIFIDFFSFYIYNSFIIY